MTHVTPKDPKEARDAQARWDRCTDVAKAFAIERGGLFPGLLPHVVAEIYDQARLWARDSWDPENDR